MSSKLKKLKLNDIALTLQNIENDFFKKKNHEKNCPIFLPLGCNVFNPLTPAWVENPVLQILIFEKFRYFFR